MHDIEWACCENSTTVGALGIAAEILFVALGLWVGQKDYCYAMKSLTLGKASKLALLSLNRDFVAKSSTLF
jgi:hypothetical protein